MNSLPPKQPRFKGIRLPDEYENIVKNEIKQDLRDPEDQDQPQPKRMIKGNFNG